MYYFRDGDYIKFQFKTRKETLRRMYNMCMSIPAGARYVQLKETGKGTIATVHSIKIKDRRAVGYDNGAAMYELYSDGMIGKKIVRIKKGILFDVYEYAKK